MVLACLVTLQERMSIYLIPEASLVVFILDPFSTIIDHSWVRSDINAESITVSLRSGEGSFLIMGRLVRALENYGLTPQDAAGVAGTFLVVKYATLAAFVPACHYVQPIRRLFWHPSRELAGRMLEQYRLRSKVRGHGRSGAAVSGGGFSGGLGLVPQTARLKLAATRARQRAWLERQKEMVALRKAGWKGRFRGFKEQQSSSTWGRKVFE